MDSFSRPRIEHGAGFEYEALSGANLVVTIMQTL